METVAYLPLLAWIIAAASLLLSAFLGIICAYHWFRYAMNPAITGIALAVYIAVCGMLLSGMFAALLILSASV